jgi:hypothetical protein
VFDTMFEELARLNDARLHAAQVAREQQEALREKLQEVEARVERWRNRAEMAEGALEDIAEALADDLNEEEGETLAQCAKRICSERDTYCSRAAAAEHEVKRLRPALEEYAHRFHWGLSSSTPGEGVLVLNRWEGRILRDEGARAAGGWSVAEEALEWLREFRNPKWAPADA